MSDATPGNKPLRINARWHSLRNIYNSLTSFVMRASLAGYCQMFAPNSTPANTTLFLLSQSDSAHFLPPFFTEIYTTVFLGTYVAPAYCGSPQAAQSCSSHIAPPVEIEPMQYTCLIFFVKSYQHNA
jgi:hypothetical protein